MSESSDPEPTEAIEHIRTKEPQAPFGADEPNPNIVSDKTLDDLGPGEDPHPGAAGYAGRDAATDMPRVPSAPETQDDPKSHDAAPDASDKDPGAHE